MPITVPSGSTFTRSNRSRTWLILFGVLAALALIAWLTLNAISGEVRRQVSATLTSTLQMAQTVGTNFLEHQRDTTQLVADSPTPQRLARDVLRGDESKREPLGVLLAGLLATQDFDGWALAAPDGRVLASGQRALGWPILPPAVHARIAEVLGGKAILLPPAWVPERSGKRPAFVSAAPIRDGGQSLGVLVLTMDPLSDFSKTLESARFGDSGETYACTKEGLLASRSRYLDDLKSVGLVPPEASSALLHLALRRPPSPLVPGKAVEGSPASWPFTSAAAAILASKPGMTLDDGFDYRGQPVVVAWAMLGDFGLGVITKIDRNEALRPLVLLHTIFITLLVLLTVAAVAGVWWISNAARLSHKLEKAKGQLMQLGQYTLERKLGEGGMGAVYRGRHALMRRPTAIKLITGKVTEDVLARFEREVQLCCRLSHPNTIAIYDYGRTADGTFYYAMELLDGMDLEAMVAKYGPLPPARVIHFLAQACGSLAEAHDLQMIHRDIKPANLFITNRGGENDVLKVLDFGLVKSLESNSPQLSRADVISGTPPYMAPEVIEQKSGIDGRSDLYALACVGYFLLTGKCVFERETAMETLMAHINQPPAPPSTVALQKIPADLEAAILHALSKDPSKRPASVRVFRGELLACADAGRWRDLDAEQWWTKHRAKAAADADKALNAEVSVSMVLKTADMEFTA
jgi:eukaryotic-like serine/threonine-protein kinase